ncbi:MAG: DUF6790 family protein [Burkholderiales bacterium]
MQEMITYVISYLLHNFPLVMLILALLLAILNLSNFAKKFSQYIFALPIGLSGIWGFVMHAFFPQLASAAIGWESSPFEFEVAIANLAIGISGLFASRGSRGYRAATATTVSIFLWGAALGHLYQMLAINNFNPGNAGSIFWTDILIPFTAWFALLLTEKEAKIDIPRYKDL